MQLENLIQNLKLVAELVVNRSTGTPNDLANRLRVTDRTIRNYIGLLRGMGGDIAYSISCQTYYSVRLRLQKTIETTLGGGCAAVRLFLAGCTCGVRT